MTLPIEVWAKIYEHLSFEDILGSFGVCSSFEGLRNWELKRRFKEKNSILDVRKAYVVLSKLCQQGKEEAIDLLTSHFAFERKDFFNYGEDITFKMDSVYYALYHCVIGKQWKLYDKLTSHPVCIERSEGDFISLVGYALGVSCNIKDMITKTKEWETDWVYCHFFLQGLWCGYRRTNNPQYLVLIAQEILTERGIVTFLDRKMFLNVQWAPEKCDYIEEDKQLLIRKFSNLCHTGGYTYDNPIHSILSTLLVRQDYIALHKQAERYLAGQIEDKIFHEEVKIFAGIDDLHTVEWIYDNEDFYLSLVSNS